MSLTTRLLAFYWDINFILYKYQLQVMINSINMSCYLLRHATIVRQPTSVSFSNVS